MTHGTAYLSGKKMIFPVIDAYYVLRLGQIGNLYILHLIDMMSSFTDKSIFPLEPE